MKTAIKPLFVGLAAYFAVKLFAKTGAASQLQFFPKKISLRFQILTPVLDLTVGIQNPTRQDFNIGSIIGQLFINNTFVGNISGYQLTRVQALSEAEFPISCRLSLSGITAEASSIINSIISGGLNALFQQKLRFKGSVNAEGFTVPLDFTYTVPHF